MHFLLNTLLLTLCHYRLTRLHGPASPFLLLKTWSLPLLLLQRLLDPLREQAWGLYIWQRGCDASWWVRMNHRFHWTLLSPCLPHTLWPILNTTHGGTAFPMLSSFLKGWTIKSSTLLTSCLPLLFRYMLNIFFLLFFFFFFLLFPYLSWLLMWEIVTGGTYWRWADWSSTPPFDLFMARMALLGSVPCPVILMSWAILSLPTLRQWVLSPLVLLFLPNFSICFSH